MESLQELGHPSEKVNEPEVYSLSLPELLSYKQKLDCDLNIRQDAQRFCATFVKGVPFLERINEAKSKIVNVETRVREEYQGVTQQFSRLYDLYAEQGKDSNIGNTLEHLVRRYCLLQEFGFNLGESKRIKEYQKNGGIEGASSKRKDPNLLAYVIALGWGASWIYTNREKVMITLESVQEYVHELLEKFI